MSSKYIDKATAYGQISTILDRVHPSDRLPLIRAIVGAYAPNLLNRRNIIIQQPSTKTPRQKNSVTKKKVNPKISEINKQIKEAQKFLKSLPPDSPEYADYQNQVQQLTEKLQSYQL